MKSKKEINKAILLGVVVFLSVLLKSMRRLISLNCRRLSILRLLLRMPLLN